jgi:hypothetical protein
MAAFFIALLKDLINPKLTDETRGDQLNRSRVFKVNMVAIAL